MSVFDKICLGNTEGIVSDSWSEPVEKTKRPTPKESEDDITQPFETLGYRSQVSTITDSDGNITEVSYGTKESRRPDAIKLEYDENGEISGVAGIVEVKNYDITTPAGQNRLQHNIRKQTDKTIKHYGDDVEITEVVDLRGQPVTVGDMMDMCDKFEEKNPEVNWDYRM